MTRYFRSSEDFVFPASFGFTKSATTSDRGQAFAKGGRAKLASGGQPEAPGPSPAAGMQPMTRKPTASPLANATVTMPAPDFAHFTGAAVKAGMKMGALAANASPKIHPGPGIMASPAAQAPQEVTPMRKGGRVRKADGGEIDVDEAADAFRRQDHFARVRPGNFDVGDSMDAKPPTGDERFEVRQRPPQRGPERELKGGGRVKRASGGAMRGSSKSGDWKDRISRQPTNPGDDNMELNAGLPRTPDMPNAAKNDLDASRDGERLRGGGRVKRAMGGPMMQPGPMAPQAAPMAQPGMPPQPSPVTATMALPMPHMAKGGALSAATRQRLPRSDFALPGKGAGPKGAGSGSYPVPDAKHARLALSMVSAHGSSAEKAAVRAKVRSKFPGIGKGNH